MIDCTNYVITHRDWPIIQDDLYRALCVGGFRKPGWLCAADGDNIEQYNDRINETTGLYWIWKNTDCEYVGLSHYRRYFKEKEESIRLSRERIENILVKHKRDIIMPAVRLGWSVHRNIGMASGDVLTDTVRNLFREAIAEKQPDYLEAFDRVMDGKFMYYCGMFVTRREIVNAYCEWLFSFLLDVVDRVDVSALGFYEKRVCGYFCEAFWTVWLMEHTDLKIHVMDLEVIR